MTSLATRLAFAICAVTLAACQQGNGKHDVFGFSPGMSRVDARALAESRKWNVDWKTQDHDEIRTDAGVMTVRYGLYLEGAPVVALGLTWKDREKFPMQATAEEISSQYGKKPDATNTVNGTTIEYIWILDEGNNLGFDITMDLLLVNKGLISKDEEVAQANMVRNIPKVKF